MPPGYSLVGCDLSGLELRCLAHYLNDGGLYAKELLEGDVHEANRIAAGLPDRSTSKLFSYAWLYGAGDLKLGSIIGKGAAEGKRLREQFLAANPALARLVRAVKATNSGATWSAWTAAGLCGASTAHSIYCSRVLGQSSVNTGSN